MVSENEIKQEFAHVYATGFKSGSLATLSILLNNPEKWNRNALLMFIKNIEDTEISEVVKGTYDYESTTLQ